ncbi:MAG: iron-sulfur cluster assembly accessory protein [Polyangiaceae bacterium]|nr:iron-sulfur cluster assembly accessory protein [Polyangiaceae bacterium]
MSEPTACTDATPLVPPVRVSPKAVEFAKKHREKLGLPGAALRVGVKGGGCAGLTYVTDLTLDAPKARDFVYDYGDLKVYLDPRSLKYIEGAVVDYENTLMWQGFKWHNPLQESSCGCGHTFNAKEKPSDGSVAATEGGQTALQGSEKKIFKTL